LLTMIIFGTQSELTILFAFRRIIWWAPHPVILAGQYTGAIKCVTFVTTECKNAALDLIFTVGSHLPIIWLSKRWTFYFKTIYNINNPQLIIINNLINGYTLVSLDLCNCK
jgi:hypothetical protein